MFFICSISIRVFPSFAPVLVCTCQLPLKLDISPGLLTSLICCKDKFLLPSILCYNVFRLPIHQVIIFIISTTVLIATFFIIYLFITRRRDHWHITSAQFCRFQTSRRPQPVYQQVYTLLLWTITVAWAMSIYQFISISKPLLSWLLA